MSYTVSSITIWDELAQLVRHAPRDRVVRHWRTHLAARSYCANQCLDPGQQRSDDECFQCLDKAVLIQFPASRGQCALDTLEDGARPSLQERIMRQAYAIWEDEGRPIGRDLDHWLRAERDILKQRRSRQDRK
ncbi:MAG: DUF2934 domain-containing protein [Alphaproteobacteria bacterium]|nr:DUF2934 domain-containing protein [Alphaproteobacteria bacterium]MBF0251208.1 DUF2934 domain-containing protein [Alphaproteobacteria bacterium]